MSEEKLSWAHWSDPRLMETIVLEDSIELIYFEYNIVSFSATNDRRIFKIIYSCVDGKWNQSERIYGEIIPAKEESYVFE
jgi:hypothetical protein